MNDAIKLFKDCMKYMSWSENKLAPNAEVLTVFIEDINKIYAEFAAPKTPMLFDTDDMHSPVKRLVNQYDHLTKSHRIERVMRGIEANYHILKILRTMAIRLFIASAAAKTAIDAAINRHNENINAFQASLKHPQVDLYDRAYVAQAYKQCNLFFCNNVDDVYDNEGECIEAPPTTHEETYHE